MPPDVKQRALSALWRLLTTLGMFGVAYILWAAQVSTIPAFIVPSSWLLYCYMLFFPTSSLAAAFVHCFDDVKDNEIKYLVIFLALMLLLYLWLGDPAGLFYVVVFGISHFCITQVAIDRTATEPAPLSFCEAPQPGAAAVEAEDSDDTGTDTDYEASLATESEPSGDPNQSAEPEKPVESQQMDSADPSQGPPALAVVPYRPSARKVFEPQTQRYNTKRALLAILVAIVTLGSFVFLVHALIDWSVRDWAFNPAPVDIAPLSEAEGFFQANKTELPIPVPNADFIPTGTLGSPCQAAPTPTPVDKSVMWRGIAMATHMPTPMPAPAPTAMPEPVSKSDPAAVPDEPIDVLKRLFDFDLPNPKPLLKWYFGLPTASQYTVIAIALLLLDCLLMQLVALAAHLVVLAIAYLASAAVLALLLIYGFTPERSLAIVLPADLAFIVSIWWAKSWLKNLTSTSSSNATGLADLSNDFEASCAQNEQRLNGADRWITVIKDILKDMTKTWADSVADFRSRLNKHRKLIEMLQYLILALTMDKANQGDLDEMTRIIDELSGKIDGLETSKGDADLMRALQRQVDELRRMAENIRTEKADAHGLEQVQEQLKRLNLRIDELRSTEPDAKALEELTGKLDQQAMLLADVVNGREKLTTGVDGLESEMGGVKQDLSSLTKTSDQHKELIERLEASEKKHTERINNHATDIGREKPKVKKLEDDTKTLKKGSSKVKEDFAILKSSVEAWEERMKAVETGQVKQEDLQKLRDDASSNVDRQISQLRLETDSKHQEVMQAHNDLGANVDERFAKSSNVVEDFQNKCKSSFAKQAESVNEALKSQASAIFEDFTKKNDEVSKRIDGVSRSIDDADKRASSALERVEALEKQPSVPLSQIAADDEIRRKVEEYVENYLVSDKFRAAVNDAQLTLKQQSQRERLRAQVEAAVEELLGTDDVQQHIYSNFKERQALNNKQSSSPDIGPSNSHAASDNTIGNDDPTSDPPGVISGGQATVPGGMSSDNTSTPIILEETTTPADVEDHYGTRGVPLGVPPGVNTGRHPLSLDRTPSAGPSSDGDGTARPSSEVDDDTLQPKRQDAEEPGESDNSTDAHASGQTDPGETDGRLLGDFLGHKLARDGTEGKRNRHKTHKQKAISKKQAQQAKDQDEVTEKKAQDEETENEEPDEDIDDDGDDAHDGADDDEPHDYDPRGPPPGSGGSHGHNGTGGNDDDDQDGNDGGAPRPPRQTHGLASSIFAPGRSSGGSSSDGLDTTGGGGGEAQDYDDNDPQDKAKKGTSNRSSNQRTRGGLRLMRPLLDRLKAALEKAEEEELQQGQGQGQPMGAQSEETQAQKEVNKEQTNLRSCKAGFEKAVAQLKQRHEQEEQAKAHPQQGEIHPKPVANPPKPGQNPPVSLKVRIKDAENMLEEAEALLERGKKYWREKDNAPKQAQTEQAGDGQGNGKRQRNRKRGKGGKGNGGEGATGQNAQQA